MLDFDSLRNIINDEFYAITNYPHILKINSIYVEEVIARVFILAYRENGKKSPGHNTINSYVHLNKPPVDTPRDSTESKIKRMQYIERVLREINEATCNYLASNGIIVPFASTMESNRKGRIYDGANMSLLNSMDIDNGFELLRYTIKGTIIDSKKISDSRLAEAYDEYNTKFNKLKEENNHLNYILSWIDMYRCETSMHFSLISDIADYILNKQTEIEKVYNVSTRKNDNTKPNIPYHLFDYFWNTIVYDINNYTDAEPLKSKMSLEAYQVLRYGKHIPQFFEAHDTESMKRLINTIVDSRIIQSVLVMYIL